MAWLLVLGKCLGGLEMWPAAVGVCPWSLVKGSGGAFLVFGLLGSSACFAAPREPAWYHNGTF